MANETTWHIHFEPVDVLRARAEFLNGCKPLPEGADPEQFLRQKDREALAKLAKEEAAERAAAGPTALPAAPLGTGGARFVLGTPLPPPRPEKVEEQGPITAADLMNGRRD